MAESDRFVELVTRCRTRCLWFVGVDVLPSDRNAQLQFLAWIERYGDRDDFVEARRLRQWLSRSSSAAFSVS